MEQLYHVAKLVGTPPAPIRIGLKFVFVLTNKLTYYNRKL
jgi:hypothetical protein